MRHYFCPETGATVRSENRESARAILWAWAGRQREVTAVVLPPEVLFGTRKKRREWVAEQMKGART